MPTIQISNLSKNNVTTQNLRDLFENNKYNVALEPTLHTQSNDLYYGLVEINDVEEAEKAVRTLHGQTFHGKRISVSVRPDPRPQISKPQIYVRNLSREVDDQKLKALFEPYGLVLSANVFINTKNPDDNVGFVEMPDKTEAEEAIKALNNTEFYGKAIKVQKIQVQE